MAERRMFAKTIINSARFLKMPSETQALYFHLGLNADDDGIVEAFSICRSIGASEDNLKILIAKGFISVLNDDLVTHIVDWNEHNKIRPDRKIDSIYKELLLQFNPEIELIEKRPRTDKKNVGTDNGRTMDGIGKDRIGEVSIGKDRKEDIYPFAEIVNYLNLKANTKYKSSSNKTKDLIKARFNEGFNFEDFKIVIDKKTTEWLKDKKMSIYLRPETLFSNKFEGYLNQVVAKSSLDLSGKTYDCSRDDEEF